MENATREAAIAAAQEIGRSIGKSLTPRDRDFMLQKIRDSVRGDLLRRYAFSGNSSENKIYGYAMAIREGRDARENYCREIEVDLITNSTRHFERSTICLHEDGIWRRTPESEVQFAQDSSGPRPPSTQNGGWLPPVGNSR